MIYLFGDTHGTDDVQKVFDFFEGECRECALTKSDYLIILGDAGICWDDGSKDIWLRRKLMELPVTTLFIDGNHENFELLNDYPVTMWNGGKVHKIEDDIIHLMRGQVFEIDGKTFFTFGGAQSVDKGDRTEGISWWPEEMPNDEEYEEGLVNLDACDYSVDYILTHTAPEEVLSEMGVNVFDGTEELSRYLANIASSTEFLAWYFGHFHEDMDFDEFHCLMDEVIRIE